MNTRRGVRRLLILLTVLYWIGALGGILAAYGSGFEAGYFLPPEGFGLGPEADAASLRAFKNAQANGFGFATGALLGAAFLFAIIAASTLAVRWVVRGLGRTQAPPDGTAQEAVRPRGGVCRLGCLAALRVVVGADPTPAIVMRGPVGLPDIGAGQ